MGDETTGARPTWWSRLSGLFLPLQIGAAATVLWAAMAADGDGGGDGGSGDGDGDGDGGDDDGDGDLGDKGKRAIERERAARAEADKARKAAEKKAKDLEDRLSKLEGANKTEQEKAIEAARKEADETARNDERAKSDARVKRAAIREVAADRLADAGDALLHLDLDDFSVDDDGEVDRKAITKALDELLKGKPYLAKDKATKKPGSADGGARPPAKGGEDGISPSERLRRAYATSKT